MVDQAETLSKRYVLPIIECLSALAGLGIILLTVLFDRRTIRCERSARYDSALPLVHVRGRVDV